MRVAILDDIHEAYEPAPGRNAPRFGSGHSARRAASVNSTCDFPTGNERGSRMRCTLRAAIRDASPSVGGVHALLHRKKTRLSASA